MNRRRFLSVTAAGLGGVAGCATSEGSENTGRTESASVPSTAGSSTVTGTTEPTRSAGPTGETTSPADLRTPYRSRERYRHPGHQLDDFEDLSRWRTITGTATAATRRFEGSQSVKLVGEEGADAAVERSIEPTDLSDTDLSVAVRSTTPLTVTFLVNLVDTAGNWASLHLRSITSQPPDVCWFRTCPGVFSVSETPPDLSRIDRIQLKVLNGSSDDAVVWVDDLRTHPKPDTGYVLFTWDDGRSDYYDTAAPVHDEYDVPGVVTMPPTVQHVGEAPFMSRPQFRERSEAGDEVVAHGTVGRTFDDVSAEELDAMLQRKKRWLVENDFDGSEFVVYPANDYDETALDVVGRYFLMGGMNQAGDVNTTGVNGFDPLVLPRTIGHDLGIAKTAVDNAATYRNCTILNFHHFETDNTMNPFDYRRLVEYVAERDGVEAITFSDLWAMRTD